MIEWENIIANKSVGIFFSDPGGAKPLLALNGLYSSDCKYFSNKTYDFFSTFNIAVNIIDEIEIDEVLEKYNFDVVLCGTSYTNDFELTATESCLKKNRLVYTFIDHCGGFESRFYRNNIFYKPQNILATDNRSYEIFQRKTESYKPLIKIVENPYHQYLKAWKPAFSRDFIFNRYHLNPNLKTVIYAPDPLSNVGGVEKFGFDEYSVYNQLFNDFNRENYNLIFKLHPNQNITFFESKLDATTILVKENIHINELIFYSNLLISFFSNILVESYLLGTKSLHYTCNLKIEDTFYFEDIKKFDENTTIFEYLNQ